MLNSQTIRDLNKAFAVSPQGFLVVDSGRPVFAVLPYHTYQTLKAAKEPQKRSQKILVTGGAGYIGSHTVKILQDGGYEVVVLDNLSTGRKEAVRDCKLIVADLLDGAALEKIFREEKIDAVIHFAASIVVEESVENPAKFYQNNVVSSLNLLDAMAQYGVNKIVFSSTAAVYGDAKHSPITEDVVCRPTSPYGETKLCFENILEWYATGYGINSVSLRYFNAAGAWPEQDLGYNHSVDDTHLIPRVLDVALGRTPEIQVFGNDYETSDGTGIRDYVHVLDIASAHVLALEKLERDPGAHIYNVGSEKGYSVLEVIDTAVEVTGRMIAMSIVGRRSGDPAKLVADASKIKTELGWQPQHDLRAILQSSWAWHQKLK